MAFRSIKEIENQMWKAAEYVIAGHSAVHSMTYEEGVEAALRWTLGKEDTPPIEEDYKEDED